MRRSLALAGAAVLLCACPVGAGGPPQHPGEVMAGGVMVKRSELLRRPPAADLGVARFWVVEKKKGVQCLFAEVSGTLPLHFHPDGTHRMYVIEGRLRMT